MWGVLVWHVVLLSKPTIPQLSETTANIWGSHQLDLKQGAGHQPNLWHDPLQRVWRFELSRRALRALAQWSQTPRQMPYRLSGTYRRGGHDNAMSKLCRRRIRSDIERHNFSL
jgi:hypothetical protein